MFILDSSGTPFRIIPFLDVLRGACLSRSVSHLPIWRFRVAPTFLIQVQPRPATQVQPGITVLFRGIGATVESGTAPPAILTQSQFEIHGLWERRCFELVQHAGDKRWRLNRRGGFHHRRAGGLWSVDRRLAKVFTGDFFRELEPGALLGENCLICGAPLSDPVSMARGVGPECAATTSVVVPFVLTKRRRRRS